MIWKKLTCIWHSVKDQWLSNYQKMLRMSVAKALCTKPTTPNQTTHSRSQISPARFRKGLLRSSRLQQQDPMVIHCGMSSSGRSHAQHLFACLFQCNVEVAINTVYLTMRCVASSTAIAEEFQVELVEHFQLNIFWSKCDV